MTRRSPISVELDLRIEERLPDQVEISAYYIVAEALTNATKHSGASEVRVCVNADQADGALRLEVADDGVGGAEFSGGTGLVGLKDRVEALGGRIDLHSPRGGGTTLRVQLPLNRSKANLKAGACPFPSTLLLHDETRCSALMLMRTAAGRS